MIRNPTLSVDVKRDASTRNSHPLSLNTRRPNSLKAMHGPRKPRRKLPIPLTYRLVYSLVPVCPVVITLLSGELKKLSLVDEQPLLAMRKSASVERRIV